MVRLCIVAFALALLCAPTFAQSDKTAPPAEFVAAVRSFRPPEAGRFAFTFVSHMTDTSEVIAMRFDPRGSPRWRTLEPPEGLPAWFGQEMRSYPNVDLAFLILPFSEEDLVFLPEVRQGRETRTYFFEMAPGRPFRRGVPYAGRGELQVNVANGHPVRMSIADATVGFPPGQGGVRFEYELTYVEGCCTVAMRQTQTFPNTQPARAYSTMSDIDFVPGVARDDPQSVAPP